MNKEEKEGETQRERDKFSGARLKSKIDEAIEKAYNKVIRTKNNVSHL